MEATTDTLPSNTLETKSETKSEFSWATIGYACLVLAFVLLLFYVYDKWQESEDVDDEEGFVEGNRQERTDPQNDFNLQEAIQELENMQENVLKTLSNVM